MVNRIYTEEFEQNAVALYAAYGGDMSAAARALDMPRRTLVDMVARNPQADKVVEAKGNKTLELTWDNLMKSQEMLRKKLGNRSKAEISALDLHKISVGQYELQKRILNDLGNGKVVPTTETEELAKRVSGETKGLFDGFQKAKDKADAEPTPVIEAEGGPIKPDAAIESPMETPAAANAADEPELKDIPPQLTPGLKGQTTESTQPTSDSIGAGLAALNSFTPTPTAPEPEEAAEGHPADSEGNDKADQIEV